MSQAAGGRGDRAPEPTGGQMGGGEATGGGPGGEPTTLARAAELLGDRAGRLVPLADRTTYRVGGPAALLVELDAEEDLAAVARAVAATGVDTLVVGRGSNLLVADEGFPGLALVLGPSFSTVSGSTDPGAEPLDAPEPDRPDPTGPIGPAVEPAVEPEDDLDPTPGLAEPVVVAPPGGVPVVVTAGGGASLPVVARQTAAAGLAGFEWAVGVPGSIGGAVRMNAGGHGSDMASCLVRVRVLDLATGEDGWVPADRLRLSYRHSAIRPDQVVVAAELALTRGDRERSEGLIRDIVRWRRQHQPGGSNAGSVFTNPPGDSAGRLIDASGAKGLRVGSAEVSTKHANFIQVDPGGRAADVVALMAAVQERVEQATGVRLVPETRLAGFDNPRVLIEGR